MSVVVSASQYVASARPVGLRSLTKLTGNWDSMVCTGVNHAEDECPEHHECVPLEEEVYMQKQGERTPHRSASTHCQSAS